MPTYFLKVSAKIPVAVFRFRKILLVFSVLQKKKKKLKKGFHA